MGWGRDSLVERDLRAYPEYLGGLFPDAHAGMAHPAVEIDRIAGLEDLFGIEFGEDLDRPRQDEDEFLAVMADPAAELLEGPRHDLGPERKNLLMLEIRRQRL